MGKTLITKNQEEFLKFFASEQTLSKSFYFTGGTALSKFYLHHRISEDLDFFSLEEFKPQDITVYIRKAKKTLKFNKFDYQQSFNRNIYQLIFSNNKFLKVEFTYFPFPQIEKPKIVEGIPVDSLVDITVNKVFTISQNPRGRDFFDLFVIFKKTGWDIFDMIKKSRIKFDWNIDMFQFGSQLVKVNKLKDDPIIRNSKFNMEDVINYFLDFAKKIGKDVVKE